jgi:PPP family 3-phenylpropionic acid transporter
MRDVRVQYFLTFGMIGAVLPYVSVFFRQAGLSEAQVGYAWAIWSAAVMVSPVAVTMLADARVDPRRLLVLASVVSGLSLLALGLVRGVGPLLGVWAAYCLASMPVLPLQDGIHFSQQRRRRERGEEPVPYHRVRVWGTVGYIVPSLVLFAFLQRGMGMAGAVMSGAAFAAAAALQATRLADPRPRAGDAAAAGPADPAAPRRLPTVAAARVLLRPNLLVFTAALVLMQMAGAAHGAFYPIYLVERVGLDAKWLGQVSNLAVVIEIFFVAGCGALVGRFGVRALLLMAMGFTALRLGLIASTTNPWVVVGTQVFHGIFLIAGGVLPQTVLDEAAEDRFRHSMQGVFVMVGGAGRVAANLAAGPIAAWSLPGLYWIAALLCTASAALIFLAFRDPARHAKTAEPRRHRGTEACPAPGPAPAVAGAAVGDAG